MFEGQRHFIGKLQAHLHHSQFKMPDFPNSKRCRNIRVGRAGVPEDVKEGHFAVLAAKTEKPQRFVVELQFLNNPAFLSLLKRAEEEYGFEQKGVLAVPCRPEELEKILQCKC
ncbi:OLC1v1034501C1 [Oldenlandia corymbosa var. corymbosa]|uniref:OLC1v1034501C1 n=1 Tax=Oldenlandia corymbosa var. corymbosa TaxID=529605 RepID=A0AAV1CTD8_OLDCO|nr:OLC1v1034501C1 [Oldenlandia corymbosa var. corymbosa]